jgi:diaminopimelate decarboxylase
MNQDMSWTTNLDFPALARQYGTPLWLLHAPTITAQIARLASFDVIRYAQKANSNIHVLRLMRAAGVMVDAVSLGEIERALVAGYQAEGEEIVFTADLLDHATLAKVVQHKIAVNAGSLDMLRQLGSASPGHRVWLRINPGFGHGHSQKTNTGGENSKHGIWHTELDAALALVAQHGLQLVGLHMHIGSGVDYGHLQQVCGAMVRLTGLVRAAGHDLQAISAGGGLSIPYHANQADQSGATRQDEVDTAHYFQLWHAARKQVAEQFGHPIRLEIEPGRFLLAQAGALLAQVRAVKNVGQRHFMLIDAGFNDLMRPAMYGSFHRISLPGRSASTHQVPYVVAGPLCESGDVFTQQEGGLVQTRLLPEAQVDDFVLIHDTGAYGASMSSNYNSRPLLPELLIDEGGSGGAPSGGEPVARSVRLIRRRQTMAELLQLELT